MMRLIGLRSDSPELGFDQKAAALWMGAILEEVRVCDAKCDCKIRSHDSEIGTIRPLIDTEPGETSSVCELAARCGYSRSHFYRRESWPLRFSALQPSV